MQNVSVGALVRGEGEISVQAIQGETWAFLSAQRQRVDDRLARGPIEGAVAFVQAVNAENTAFQQSQRDRIESYFSAQQEQINIRADAQNRRMEEERVALDERLSRDNEVMSQERAEQDVRIAQMRAVSAQNQVQFEAALASRRAANQAEIAERSVTINAARDQLEQLQRQNALTAAARQEEQSRRVADFRRELATSELQSTQATAPLDPLILTRENRAQLEEDMAQAQLDLAQAQVNLRTTQALFTREPAQVRQSTTPTGSNCFACLLTIFNSIKNLLQSLFNKFGQ